MTDSYTSLDDGVAPSASGAGDLADQVKNLGKDAKAKASELAETVVEAAKDQANEIGATAKEIAADAGDRVKLAIDEQKTASADYLGKIAQATQRAAGEFETDAPQAALYIRKAAGEIETVANAVRNRDVRELFTEVSELARRQPTLFFGGALILGFAGLRFLKSSGPGSAPKSLSARPYASAESGDISQFPLN